MEIVALPDAAQKRSPARHWGICMYWKATIRVRFAPTFRGRSISRGSPAQERTSGRRFFPPWQADQQDLHRPRVRRVRRDRGFRMRTRRLRLVLIVPEALFHWPPDLLRATARVVGRVRENQRLAEPRVRSILLQVNTMQLTAQDRVQRCEHDAG